MIKALGTRGGRIVALCVIESISLLFAYLGVSAANSVALATLPALLAALSDRRSPQRKE